MIDAKTTETDPERLLRYVEAFFARSENTDWPTVKQAARSLRWTQQRVEDAIEGDPEQLLFLSSYFACTEPTLGEHFVESAA